MARNHPSWEIEALYSKTKRRKESFRTLGYERQIAKSGIKCVKGKLRPER